MVLEMIKRKKEWKDEESPVGHRVTSGGQMLMRLEIGVSGY